MNVPWRRPRLARRDQLFGVDEHVQLRGQFLQSFLIRLLDKAMKVLPLSQLWTFAASPLRFLISTGFPRRRGLARYLEFIRWPDGSSCPKCGLVGEPYRFATRSSVVLRCRGCKANTSLTAGTVMQSSHTPLSTWFWGAYLMTTQTPGQSAVQFQRQLALSRYETAFQILHKLRAGMVRPERDAIGGEHPVEVDECMIGGETRGEGRGIHHKSIVVGAVEVRSRTEDGKKHKRRVYAGRLRLRAVPDRSADALTGFVKDNVALGSVLRTDGWTGYPGLPEMGYCHEALTLGGDPDKAEAHLPMIYRKRCSDRAFLDHV